MLAVIGTVALVYSVIEAPSKGWLSARTLAGLGQARASVALATHLGGTVAAQAHTAFADGFRLALLIAAGLVIAAAIAVAILLRGRDRSASGTAA